MSYQTLFERDLPLGHLTAVSLPEPDGNDPEDVLKALHPKERAFALDQPPRRRVPWIGGRIAMKNSLKRFGAPIVPLLATPRGAPILPPGFVGSISHKQSIAVCLVSPDAGCTLGVDIEREKPPREGIESMILTEEENSEIIRYPSHVRWRDLLLRFSLKESIYKAIDPYVKRFVGFQEVEVSPQAKGRADIRCHLKNGEGPFQIEAHWVKQNEHFITSIRVKPGEAIRTPE